MGILRTSIQQRRSRQASHRSHPAFQLPVPQRGVLPIMVGFLSYPSTILGRLDLSVWFLQRFWSFPGSSYSYDDAYY